VSTLVSCEQDSVFAKRGFVSLVRDMGLHVNGLYFYNNTVVDVAIEARRALEKPQSSNSLLAMLEYDGEYGGLARYWADSARVFRHVWYEV